MAKKSAKRPPVTKQLQAAPRCVGGVCAPERTQGLKAPAPAGSHALVNLQGPGVFLAAEVSKQGGTNDLTFVILDIDGKNVTNLSFAAAINQGLTQHNPYGLVVTHSASLKDDDDWLSGAAVLQEQPAIRGDGERAERRANRRQRHPRGVKA